MPDPSRGKLTLVTGAAGLVGSRIVARFLGEGMRVRAVDRRPVDVAGVESHAADVTDQAAMDRAATGAGVIVHCAAVIAGTPEDTLRVNVEKTRALVEAALRARCERSGSSARP